MPICETCKRPYDNGTNSIHGCDPLDMLRDFRDAFGRLSNRDLFDRINKPEPAIALLDLYLRVRKMLGPCEAHEVSGIATPHRDGGHDECG